MINKWMFQVEQNLANYRTLLIELLVKIRIKSPASLNNLTIGEMFQGMDWAEAGHSINTALVQGQHNSLCLAHGRKPLIPYQAFTPPPFTPLPRGGQSQCSGHSPRHHSPPSYHDLFSVSPLRSSSLSSISASLSFSCVIFLALLLSW